MDRANHALADYLGRAGEEVHVVAHRVSDDLLALPAVQVHVVPRPVGSDLLGGPLLDRVARWWARRLGGELRTIVNGGNCRAPGASWVHYVHAAYQPTLMGPASQRLRLALSRARSLRRERTVLAHAAPVFANSQRTARDVIERLAVPEERVRVVYYGSDPSRFRPPTREERAAARKTLGVEGEEPIALFLGALGDRRKGFDVVFEAWRRLGPEAALAVVGTGQELPAWRGRAEAAGLRVRFLGFRSDVPHLLAGVDLLVAPTRYEAYGLGVHEALCCGVPVLVSEDAGVAERLPETLSGMTLPARVDAPALAEALEQALATLDDARGAVAPVGAELRSRTWDAMASELVEAMA